MLREEYLVFIHLPKACLIVSRKRFFVFFSIWVRGIWGGFAQIQIGGSVLFTNQYCALKIYSLGDFKEEKLNEPTRSLSHSANACVETTLTTPTTPTERGFFRWIETDKGDSSGQRNILELTCVEDTEVFGIYTVVLPLWLNGAGKGMTGFLNSYSNLFFGFLA